MADFPEVASTFDETKNRPLLPEHVAAGSNRLLWWRCERARDHEWRAAPSERTVGSGCPFCAGKRVSITNRLPTVAPSLVEQWHPVKNGGLTPADLVGGSNRVVWWKCPNGPDHEWQRSVNHRTRGAGCPFCAARRVSVTNCLATIAPQLAQEWHPIKNGSLTPKDIVAGSCRRVWWKCPKGPDHEWQASVDNRVRGRGCPFCIGKPIKRISADNCLAARAPQLVSQWHTTKNGKVTPYNVPPGTPRKAWWKCPVGRQHVWQASILSRVQGAGCPVCSGDLVIFSTSLAAHFPDIARQWHPAKNGDLTPDRVAPHAGTRVWWKCPEGPDHEWQCTVDNRTRRTSQARCPFCSNRRLSVTNSLANWYPKVAQEWHPTMNGELSPLAITAMSSKRVWWKCQFGHVWIANIRGRTHLGTGCPICARGRGRKVVTTAKSMRNVRLASYHGPHAGPVTRKTG